VGALFQRPDPASVVNGGRVLIKTSSPHRHASQTMDLFSFNASTPTSYTFEDFLRDAHNSGIPDPGSAMVSVLKRRRVSGIDIDGIIMNGGLDPRNKPSNIICFLRHICENGVWGVNLSVNVD
jgi:hypothetical protein